MIQLLDPMPHVFHVVNGIEDRVAMLAVVDPDGVAWIIRMLQKVPCRTPYYVVSAAMPLPILEYPGGVEYLPLTSLSTYYESEHFDSLTAAKAFLEDHLNPVKETP